MLKIIFGIFAHPDDETLVAGTLMKQCADGAEINLITVTDGQAGVNPMNVADLGATRLDEWHHSAETINATTTHALHLQDGNLTLEDVPTITAALQQIILAHLATIMSLAELSFVTFDQDGLTGHKDHRVVTEAVMRLFAQISLKLPPNVSLKELACYRLSTAQATAGPSTPEYPLAGYNPEQIDRQVDVHQFVSRKKMAMACHVSQAGDMEKWKQLGDELLSIECFRIIQSTAQES